MKKKILAMVLALIMLLVIPVYADNNAERTGISFTATDKYMATKVVSAPNTFEAWVNIPSTLADGTRGGVILGTYGLGSPNFSFEVHEKGAPRLYVEDSDKAKTNDIDVKFSTVDLRTGTWTHVAIVRDNAAGELRCYINGELKETKSISFTGEIVANSPVCMGGDYRSGNAQYFKGQISSAAMYSDARTQAEIAADMLSYGKDGLLCAYEASEMNAYGVIPDKSGNGADMRLNRTWFSEKEPVTDYAYSFALVGDTQRVSFNDPDKFHVIYDWLLANAESKKIKFVMGLGDITEKSAESEWEIAAAQIKRLNGKIPYSVVRGNHDKSTDFLKYFPIGEYEDKVTGTYQENMLNTYTTFTVGDIKYLVMALDFGASDKVLSWASYVVENHPDHNVIVTTHAYLYRNGTTLDQNEVCPPATNGGYNNGDHMWDKFIKNHENIVMVISGHDPCDHVVVAQDKGVHGNTVTQMLVDPQGTDNEHGSTGMVAMLYFSEDGRDVTVEYYSTIKEQYFMTSNQFTMTVDTVKEEADDPIPPPVGDNGNNGGNGNNNNNNNTDTDKEENENTDTENSPAKSSPEAEKAGTGKIVYVVIGAVAGIAVVAGVISVIIAFKKKKK